MLLNLVFARLSIFVFRDMNYIAVKPTQRTEMKKRKSKSSEPSIVPPIFPFPKVFVQSFGHCKLVNN